VLYNHGYIHASPVTFYCLCDALTYSLRHRPSVMLRLVYNPAATCSLLTSGACQWGLIIGMYYDSIRSLENCMTSSQKSVYSAPLNHKQN